MVTSTNTLYSQTEWIKTRISNTGNNYILDNSVTIPGNNNGWSNDYYNGVRILPQSFNLGIVSQNKVLQVTIWNTGNRDITFSSYTVVNASGITTKTVFPLTVSAYSEYILTINVSANGQGSFDGLFILNIQGSTLTKTIEITGNRTVILDMASNWANSSPTLSIDYLTLITESLSGQEYREAHRSIPRYTLRHNTFLDYNQYKQINMLSNYGIGWYVTDSTRCAIPSNAPKMNDTTITFPSLSRWMIAGTFIVVGSGNDSAEMAFISAVSGTTVTLSSALTNDHSVYYDVRPLLPCFLDETQDFENLTAHYSSTDATYNITDGMYVDNISTPTYSSFDNFPVFPFQRNAYYQMGTTYASKRVEEDYSYGIREYFVRGYNYRVYKNTYNLMSTSEIENMKDFFHMMKGSQGEFIYCNENSDLVPVTNIVANTYSLVVEGLEVSQQLYGDNTFVYVCLLDNNGDMVLNKITNVGVSSDGNNTLITCANAWTTSFLPSFISLGSVCRFVSDTLTLEYITSEYAKTALSIQTLPYNDSEW